MDVVLYNHQIWCEKAVHVFCVLDPLDTVVFPDVDCRMECVPFINGPHADGGDPVDELRFEVLVKKNIPLQGHQFHDLWIMACPLHQLVVRMDEDPFLEEGDKPVFLPEMVEMPDVPPTEWVINVFATFRTVSFVELFPDHLPLEC